MERDTDLLFPQALSSTLSQSLSFEKTMLNASVDCIKLISSDGRLVTMNRAGCLALGVPEDSAFGMPWLPLLPPAVHAAGERALAEARQGATARFPGRSENDGETRYWDNLLTPFPDETGNVRVILCVSRDVTAKTLLEWQLEEAVAREQLLAQEMRHRIKNLFLVVSGLISMSEKEALHGDDAITILKGKLASFSRVSDAVFEPNSIGDADKDNVGIKLVVTSVLAPYADRYSAEGDAHAIPRSHLTALILFLHELATNSIKYGAFGADEAKVAVTWTGEGTDLVVKWAENCEPRAPRDRSSSGFGSNMIVRLARSIGGSVVTQWTSGGLVTQLRFPLKQR